ncbi:MAG: phosphopantetheine-protein transferase [Pedosphaera sp.]|nr:phosphopantetheine-protein transferase [Pedosphaera sp.]
MTSDLKLQWPQPPKDWTLHPGEVHVWATPLDQPARLSAFAATLSPDEQTRAARYHFDRDRNRFIVGRGWLRTLLGQYLQLAPSAIQLEYGNRGKPALCLPSGHTPFHFNLAHSAGLALLGVTRLCDLGVDVEQIRPLKDAESIAGRFFSPAESAGLKATPLSQKSEVFFNLWTRKEAWLKATGKGIADSLDQVEVSFSPAEPAQLLRLFGDSHAAAQWRLFGLTPAIGFTGTLALPVAEAQICLWSWPE